jgi:hypothetical protein
VREDVTLDPGADRHIILAPEDSLAGAAIGEPAARVEYDLAAQAKNAKAFWGWIVGAGTLALLSFFLGALARKKGWKKKRASARGPPRLHSAWMRPSRVKP